MSGSLDGPLVLDLSRVLAGPWASQTLVDPHVVDRQAVMQLPREDQGLI